MIKETTHTTPERWKALSLFLIVSIAIAASTLAEDTNKRVAKTARPLPALTTLSLSPVGGTWTAQGPGPIQNGQVEGITNSPVTGAIDTVVSHPINADILWIGSVNGGIWKTTNATSATPTWTAQTDTAPSLSIRTIERDPTDATHQTLVAGTGYHSSFWGFSGPVGSLLRTTNGGTIWLVLNPSTLAGESISGIAARGSTMVATVHSSCNSIYRSTDTGASFSLVAGLPQGFAWDLASDPNNNAVLYTAISTWQCTSGSTLNGIYKSTDTGATWTRVSNSTMNALLANSWNAKISVGAAGQVYVGIVTIVVGGGQLGGIFRSGDGGTNWTQLDTPTTVDSGIAFGIHPGKQGSRVFSIAADPTNANLVYVGGDAQPLYDLPNSIGARDYTGRLFRVNAAAGAGSQSTPLTHCQNATAACNNSVSTNSKSAPHGDSRDITFDANGNLVETDDGGIYRRTNPAGTGDWFSVNGNLQITEMHNVVYDRVSNMIMGGSQDNGTSEQTIVGGSTWTQVTGGDGGDVAVDDTTTGTQSTRYSGVQYLGIFLRRMMNSSGVETSWRWPSLVLIGGGPSCEGQFTTPVELNRVDPRRILFACDNDLYESLDRGDSYTALGFNESVAAIAYGGRASGVDNVDVIYAIRRAEPNVFLRTSGGGAPVQTPMSPGTFGLRDIAVDGTDWRKAYVVDDAGQVYSTSNAGAAWTNVTGDLGGGSTDFRTIVHISGNPSVIAVGGVNGVFRMATNNPGVWNQLGTGMSNAIVYDLDYDALDDVLIAGTLGRGVWKLSQVAVSGTLPSLSINDLTVTEGSTGTTNATFTVSLSASVGYGVGVDYATANGTANGQSASEWNDFLVSIPDSGNSTTYPTSIDVSGIMGPIRNVTVTLHELIHDRASDLDVLLVGPGGQAVMLMSDVGGGTFVAGPDLTFDDAAATQLPQSTTLLPGTYRPTDFGSGDTFSSPAPGGPYGTALSVFNGTSANGTWNLYVVDDAAGGSGVLWDGWSLTLTAGDYSPASGTLLFNPGTTSRTVSVTVHGDTTAELSETFLLNLSNASNAMISANQGLATITNDDAIAVPTNVVAAATTTTNVNINWTAAPVASTYRVYRSSGGAYTLVGETSGTVLSDATAAAGTAYLYKVRSFAGIESPDSNIDLATTVLFTDPTLTAGTTPIKLAHFNELRTAVNAVRTLAGLSTFAFTAPTPATTVTVRVVHMNDLRSALNPARTALSLPAQGFTDPTITVGTTAIKAAHINEVRNGVQ